MSRRPLRHETRLLLLALAGGAPALAIALVACAHWDTDPVLRVTVAGGAAFVWLFGALAVREQFVRPLQTLANLLGALREGDTSLRARGADPDDAMGLALWEINALGAQLRAKRYEALEATSLLRQVMESIDVALFAFDPEGRLRLVNRGAEDLLGLPAERALGRDAASLGLAPALAGETPRLIELRLAARAGRWEVRRGVYRHDGRPHQLVVLSDLSRSLREEERQAWQRLIRVLSHEINNSLAPIQSLAGSLQTVLGRAPAGAARDADVHAGLRIIETRAQSLARFMQAYARLARLPAPVPGRVEVGEWVRRVAALETRRPVEVVAGPAVVLRADGDQLDALLINLVRNAADASLETDGRVTLRWHEEPGWMVLAVEDDGPGLAETANLFVPFFTTKPDGSGIGLVLARQVAEAHGGTLELRPREGARGARAELRLPLRDALSPASGSVTNGRDDA